MVAVVIGIAAPHQLSELIGVEDSIHRREQRFGMWRVKCCVVVGLSSPDAGVRVVEVVQRFWSYISRYGRVIMEPAVRALLTVFIVAPLAPRNLPNMEHALPVFACRHCCWIPAVEVMP
jgi:hypothetical protein